MNKINFQNSPNQTTPVNAANLNQMQDNIDDAKVEKRANTYDGDLNDLKAGGTYATYTNTTNKPDSGAYFIEVIAFNNNYLMQRATKRPGASFDIIYQRYCSNGTWGDWINISPPRESGSWTPAINTMENVAPTVTYTKQRGSYKKIGNMVFISFYISGKITALNGTNNYAVVSGLPFVPKSYDTGECAITLGMKANLTTSSDPSTLCVLSSHNGVIHIRTPNGGNATVLKTSGENNFYMAGSGWYETE